jgi:membrane protein YdbS with pleckstrin-like domain
MQKRIRNKAVQHPDDYEITTKKIKKKASVFSIVTLFLLLMSILYYVASGWLSLLFSILFIISLFIAMYFFIFEKELEFNEYRSKKKGNEIKILY